MSFALNGYIWVVLGIGVRQGRGACLGKTWIKGGSRLWNQHCKMGFGQFSFCFAGCWALCCQLCPWLKMYVRGCSNLCRDGRTSIHLIPPTCILDSRMLQSRPPTWRLLLFSLHREFVNALIKQCERSSGSVPAQPVVTMTGQIQVPLKIAFCPVQLITYAYNAQICKLRDFTVF